VQRRRGRTGPRVAEVEEIAARVAGLAWAATEGYEIRTVTGAKRYRCPWCQQWIEPGTAHVVAFPAGQAEERRHYHAPCWARHIAGKR
jgi:hypothetical protein